VMQRDALERLNLQQMLLEPEMMQAVEPDVPLVANLMSLSQIMPAKTKETARLVVQKVVDELLRKLTNPIQQAVSGSLNRAVRNRRPRHNEITGIERFVPTCAIIKPHTRQLSQRRESVMGANVPRSKISSSVSPI
jgi:hypothetical protein